jgi:hypothetical protein
MIKNVIGPGIVIYKNIFPESMNLVKRYENSIGSSWSNATTNENSLSQGIGRFCKDFIYNKDFMPKENVNWEELVVLYDEVMDKFKTCILDYEKDYPVKVDFFESLNIIKYSPNNFFNYHSDDGPDIRYTVSCLGYINDDYEGGNLHFKFFDINYTPEMGDLAIFPSSYIYTHAAYPIKSGTKYVAALMTDRTEKGHKSDRYK